MRDIVYYNNYSVSPKLGFQDIQYNIRKNIVSILKIFKNFNFVLVLSESL